MKVASGPLSVTKSSLLASAAVTKLSWLFFIPVAQGIGCRVQSHLGVSTLLFLGFFPVLELGVGGG